MYTDNNILINMLFEKKANFLSKIGRNNTEIICRSL